MNWDAFFGTLFFFAILAGLVFGGYWTLQFVCWSCTAVLHAFGQGWAIALGCTYAVFALAFVIGVESNA